MNALKTLSHNILYAHIGFDGAGVPVVQTSALQAANSLQPFTDFLRLFAQITTDENWQAYELPLLLNSFGPEFYTIKAVLTELAYSNREFSPSTFAEGLYKPNIWIGQSYHRLTSLSRKPANSATIKDTILSLAAEEAAAVYNAITTTANNTNNLILLDADAYAVLAGGDECV